MNGDAVFNVMIGAAFGSAITICVVQRRWWVASAGVATGIWEILFVLSHEPGSPAVRHAVRFWVFVVLVAYYVAAMVMDRKARRGGKHPGEPDEDSAGPSPLT